MCGVAHRAQGRAGLGPSDAWKPPQRGCVGLVCGHETSSRTGAGREGVSIILADSPASCCSIPGPNSPQIGMDTLAEAILAAAARPDQTFYVVSTPHGRLSLPVLAVDILRPSVGAAKLRVRILLQANSVDRPVNGERLLQPALSLQVPAREYKLVVDRIAGAWRARDCTGARTSNASVLRNAPLSDCARLSPHTPNRAHQAPQPSSF